MKSNAAVTSCRVPDASELSKWLDHTRQLFGSFPADYKGRREALAEANHLFKTELALSLQTGLNEHLQAEPHDTYAERKLLASFVNHELREFGLAICCPRTGRPTILVADIRSASGTPRFRLEARDDDGGKCRTMTSSKLFDLILMEDAPRKEGRARWPRGD